LTHTVYCHSEPPLTSGKLCFIINFIGGHGGRILNGGVAPVPPIEPPLSVLDLALASACNQLPV